MTNTSKLPQAQKLVTFALFAYNQEKYIIEAVEGAFAQTYEPLEIIISDDCSSDQTFEIIKEMAGQYPGPHRVIVRQSQTNRGLVRHIRDVVETASGDIVVVAAGDDISFSQRTKELVSLMEKEGAEFAASNYSRIGSDGYVKPENISNDYSGNYIWQIADCDPKHFASGASAAYRKDFILSALSSAKKTVEGGGACNEDIIFAAYAAAKNTFPSSYTDGPLLGYRINTASLSNFQVVGDSFKEELSLVLRERFRASTRLASLNAILEISETHPRLYKKLNHEKIRYDISVCKTQISAFDPKFTNRARALIGAKGPAELRVILPRILGPSCLSALRVIRKKLRGKMKR